jgi:hypothetical protein
MKTPTVLSRDALEIYLNDHLLGATAGVELARRSAGENEGNEFGEPLGLLADEIDEDRSALVAFIEELGYRVDRIKVAAGWSAEKLGRLKPNGQVTGYSPLGRLLELEGLLAGIHGKQALWRTLLRAELVDPARLELLLERAKRQVATVQRLHRSATDLALTHVDADDTVAATSG